MAKTSEINEEKNANNTCFYYNVEGAVFRAQGPYLNIENAVSL